jgi:hypothetical protein
LLVLLDEEAEVRPLGQRRLEQLARQGSLPLLDRRPVGMANVETTSLAVLAMDGMK